MKDITFKQFLISTIILFTVVGITVGTICTHTYYSKQISIYREYINTTENLLDTCDKYHNICDTVCEMDIYEDYMDLYNKLK